ncbi:MAG: DUF1553 domain-containing protein [Bryobacterales bacterium]
MKKSRWDWIALAAAGLCLVAVPLRMAAADQPLPETVEFNRDIRPILSDKCFTCHGPDEANRQTALRFDTRDGAFAQLPGGGFAIVAGEPQKSELLRRITAENEVLRMPPVYSGRTLTTREKALFERWIAQGAEWQGHWSFLPPKRPALPPVQNPEWPRNAVDHFVLRRLEGEGLSPSPEADRARLIRRVTLDLTGLPPTPAEVDAFLRDRSPEAYEKVVDRLLASPRYGERMAVHWLDAARYADTNGYQTDAERFMWRWRDWVINAFNRNMPFDQFTLEQIAGDMLPDPTLDQKIATGFNRNHRGNGEGGIIAEEYAVEYVVDRVETTSTVWLGMTLGCARCHDHKYDPLTQQEFYRVFAYFNNIPERGKAFKYGNSPPYIPAPTREQREQLAALDGQIAAAERHFGALAPEAERAQREWEQNTKQPIDWSLRDGLIAHYRLDDSVAGELFGSEAEKKLDPQPREGQPAFVDGKLGRAMQLDGQAYVEAGDVASFDADDKFTLAAWVYSQAADGAILSRTLDENDAEGYGYKGYGIYLKDGKVQVNLVQRWLDDALRVETKQPADWSSWRHVMMTYDGSRLADGLNIYIDGVAQELNVIVDEMNQSFRVAKPLRIGAAGVEKRFRGSIDEVRIYDRLLTPAQAAVVADPAMLNALAAIKQAARTQAQADKLRLCFLDEYAPASVRQAWKQLRRLQREREEMVAGFPTVMVMQERETRRDTHLLVRGAYDAPGEKVEPGVPAVLSPMREGLPNNRLGFARWLIDPANPLTARVIVNRFWQTIFGTGLVKTVEDFGSQGEWPTHPELLDWLATEFVQSGWDVKGIVKTIVMSATYRQSSKAEPALLQRDPENRLLARGPRFRLPAEVVRDQALAVSGLLVEDLGGPSVKPYQPAGLWSEMSGSSDYPQDHGDKLYRRSLYTYWRRTMPPPSMTNFDAAGREACTVRATRTNTPLQALNLMNDVTFVESSRLLAERMMKEGGSTPQQRVGYAFQLATSRTPQPQEQQVLADSFHYHLDRYQTDREAALKLLSEGEHPRDETLDVRELAAYTAVASLILNLDETVTKE